MLKLIKFVPQLCLLIYLMCSCSAQKNQVTPVSFNRTGEVWQIASDRSSMTVLSNYKAESLAKAVRYAEMNAIENILFKGIPNSVQEHPMVKDETEALKKHRATLIKLIDNGEYEKFVIKSFVDYSEKHNQYFFVRQAITFDINSLRIHLEKEGVINKFGL